MKSVFTKSKIWIRKAAVAVMALAISAASATTSMAGWVNTPQGKKYQWGDGAYCENGWVIYDSHWYYFGSDQLLRTGWINPDGNWYFASNTGALQGGLLKINGNAYYMDMNSLKLRTGMMAVDGEYYQFTENGTANGSPYIYQEWNSNGSIKQGVPLPK